MNQPVDPLAPAIGACLDCRQLFLVTPGSANCLTCGQPPGLILPFVTTRPEPVEAPVEQSVPAEEPALEYIPSTMDARDILLTNISTFLAGAAFTADDIVLDFIDMGADPEAAATAVGRLAAVRELITKLESAPRVTSAVLEEPAPAYAEPALVAPDAGAPPAQEDADRTNPDSP